jgi:hypothetical protein
MWEKGVPAKRVSLIYQINIVTFKSMRKAAGYFVPHGGHHLRGEKLEKKLKDKRTVIKDLENGKTFQQINKQRKIKKTFIAYVSRCQHLKKEIFVPMEKFNAV